jgi:broad specificity phosphatase PhoE
MMRHMVLAAAALLGATSCASSYTAGGGGFGVAATTPTRSATATTVYVVRHAEAGQDGTQDPALTAAGERRAHDLRAALGEAGITAIYASPYRRTQDTAAPLAEVLGLEVRSYDPGDSGALARRIPREHAGRSVLVVGHSNTVPLVVEALGAVRPPDLAHAEHDPMWIVRLTGRKVELARLRYGAASDTSTAHE